MVAPRKSVLPRNCAECGTEFKPRDNLHTGRYCSRKCVSKARGLKPTPCEWCQTMFQPVKDGARRFCSRSCAAKWTGKNRMSSKGYVMTAKGYKLIYMPEHPNAKRGYIQEHRYVMEQKVGRLLTPEEVVHHMNHVKTDNRPENLQLMMKRDHDKLNLPRQSNLTCPCCGTVITTSRPVRIVATN